MTTHHLVSSLTLPEALMAFLHADNGRPFETARPQALTATAELAELVVAGHAHIEDERVIVDAPAVGERDWVTEVTSALAGHPVGVASWIKQRREALAVQQNAAATAGVLNYDRGKLLGLFGYDRHEVDPEVKQALTDALCGPDAESDPRLPALARLLVKARLHSRHEFDSGQRARLQELAERAERTPVPRTATRVIDVAVGYAIYTSITDG
ncbi:Golgi phosphoprotein 3 (GPP34) [Actinopolyspora xinjiangensis]|uniref:Golgi phosphoprotein 3 (GPP34) n=1 Tax=Actinopolyspora xinjiangensis TaxID=405564 RepID=A0A1H0V9H9_9ACTN|nr:GPP34 family phosphoprotein [Actinopolyspora xinjiangensis]SDP74746.1 Golgi phosphoprotein 3 (GPP34) [Actinopolyspora xinjiangensis]